MSMRLFPAVLFLALAGLVSSASSAANAPWGANRYDTVGFGVSGEWRDFGDFGDSVGGIGLRGVWQPVSWLAADARFAYFERTKGEEGRWDGVRTRVVPLEAALAGVLPLGEHAALFAGGGVGWYSLQVRSPKRDVLKERDEEGRAVYERIGGVTKNTDAFGGFVFAGGRVEITESVWLAGEIRYTFLSADCTLEGVDGKVKADADGVGVSAGVVFGL